MRYEPGFVKELRQDFAALCQDARDRLSRLGSLSQETLVKLLIHPQDSTAFEPDHLRPEDVGSVELTESCAQAGELAVANGEVAFVIVADELSLTQLPILKTSLLALSLSRAPRNVPVWIMVPAGSLQSFAGHISALSPLPIDLIVFEQFEACRLRPDNRIDFLSPGVPDFYATGDGDMSLALGETAVMSQYPKVKHCFITFAQNVLARFDLGLLGLHVTAHPAVTCEITSRMKGDAEAIPCWENGNIIVADVGDLSGDFVGASPYVATGTMVVDASVLLPTPDNTPDTAWRRRRKQVGTKIVTQFERSLFDIIRHKTFSTKCVFVDREERYLVIRDENELQRADDAVNGNQQT